MRSLLARVGLGRATGIYFDGERVTVASATRTLAGIRVTAGARHPCPAGREGDMLRALSGERALSGSVVIGLPAAAAYFSTLPADDASANLADSIPPSILGGDRRRGAPACDGITWHRYGIAYRTVAATGGAQARTIAEALSALGVRDASLIPAPVALHRAALRVGDVPRAWRTAIHVILGGARGLALLGLGRVVVGWRPFAVAPGAEIYCVASAVRSLAAHLRDTFGLPDLDGVLIHGESADTLAAACGEQFALDSRAAPSVGLGESAVAEALARHGLRRGPAGIDLLRPLRGSPGPLAAFPRRTAAAFLAVVAAGGLLMTERAREIEAGADAARRMARVDAEAGGFDLAALAQGHARLEAEVEEAATFAARRIRWAPILRELPALLPEGVRLTSLEGDNALAAPDTRTGKRAFDDRLALSLDVPCEEGVSFPGGPQETLAALGACPSLRQAFRIVEGGSASRIAGSGGDPARLAFAIDARNPEPKASPAEGG